MSSLLLTTTKRKKQKTTAKNYSLSSLSLLRKSSFSSKATTAINDNKIALVVGSSGALGSFVAHHLSHSLGMKVIGADVEELPNDFNEIWELDGFVKCPAAAAAAAAATIDSTTGADLTRLSVELTRGVDYCLRELGNEMDQEDLGLDAIVCANGGWKGDPPFLPNDIVNETLDLKEEDLHRMEKGAVEFASTITDMMQRNLDPVLAASYVAQHYCNAGALMVVMGAAAALAPTPGMLGYGLAKTASHHLVQTLGASTGQSLTSKSLRKAGRQARRDLPALDDLSVVGILPTMIDTRANRKANPKGDFDQWTKPGDIAREIGTWIENPHIRPHSGSLVKVYPKDGVATFELAR